MHFNIDTFLDDIKKLGKLQSIVYDNGVEAAATLSAVTTAAKDLVVYSSNKMFHNVADQLADKEAMFGFIIGKVNKNTVSHVYFNLNAFLLKNGKLVIYNPYNDIVSLIISGSRKYNYIASPEKLYVSTLTEILEDSTPLKNGPSIYKNYTRSFSWNVPSNAVASYNLFFTKVTEPKVNVDSLEYNGVMF